MEMESDQISLFTDEDDKKVYKELKKFIAKFIEKKGEGIHHIAFAVPDVQAALDEAESKGVKLIDKAPRGGAEGLNIAFLHPKSTCSVLTELCMPGK